jgi:hypothetical protein
MKFTKRMLFSLIDGRQQADGTSGAQTPLLRGLSYLTPNDIL